jgi:hypothetical protein
MAKFGVRTYEHLQKHETQPIHWRSYASSFLKLRPIVVYFLR